MQIFVFLCFVHQFDTFWENFRRHYLGCDKFTFQHAHFRYSFNTHISGTIFWGKKIYVLQLPISTYLVPIWAIDILRICYIQIESLVELTVSLFFYCSRYVFKRFWPFKSWIEKMLKKKKIIFKKFWKKKKSYYQAK